MKEFLLQIFTWWNGQTIGTRFFTWRKGKFVGEDEFGNRYYHATVPPLGERRWVIYSGLVEATKIPPGWHGWMHHRTDTPPSEAEYVPHPWEKPHRPNPTGTAAAHRPAGSILRGRPQPADEADYSPWTP